MGEEGDREGRRSGRDGSRSAAGRDGEQPVVGEAVSRGDKEGRTGGARVAATVGVRFLGGCGCVVSWTWVLVLGL